MLTTATARPKSGFFIGVGCPGCGGELQLDADFFVTRCEHCGSVLRIIRPQTPVAYMVRSGVSESQARFHLDHYLKENDLPLTGSQLMIKRLYYPYWRVEGRLLKLRNKVHKRSYHVDTGSGSGQEVEVSTEKSEISVSPYEVTVGAGSSMHTVPDTLGIRAETVTLLPFSDDNLEEEFDALPVTRSWESVQQRLRLAVGTVAAAEQAAFGENITRLFDPVFSLVYFPYLIIEGYSHSYRRFAVDGLTGRVLGTAMSNDGDNESNENGGSSVPLQIPFGELDVDFHRCTNCGEDLPAQLSHVYVCRNCHQLRMLERSSYSLPRIDVADCEATRHDKFVPFWRLSLPDAQAKMFRTFLGGLGTPDELLIPALRSNNFEAIHRLSKRMTAARDKIQLSTIESLDDRCLAVRISLSEAIAQAEMLLCRELVALGRNVSDGDVKLTPYDVGLMYVPFRLESYFYVDSVINAVGFEKRLIE